MSFIAPRLVLPTTIHLAVSLACIAGLLHTPVLRGQTQGQLYQLEFDRGARVLKSVREHNGKPALFITVQFKIKRLADGQLATDVVKDEILVEEDGRRVADLEIYQPRARDTLTSVLALDISGSMAKHDRIREAKNAARAFLDRLHSKADVGLILFDHEMRVTEPPAGSPEQFANQRLRVRGLIDEAKPLGGTAWIDATANAVRMLKDKPGRKAVVVMTDGVDLNSQATLREVIQEAQTAEVPVYTVGVGEPGKNEAVTTVLVLDRSGSMRAPANDTDRTTKMEAMQRAASRFVDLMRSGARTTLLPFSSRSSTPEPFSDDKPALKKGISALRPAGETAFFDATYDAIETLEAGGVEGKRAVVVLTDGIDNRSRRRVSEVVRRAQEAEVPVHMLGLGRSHELKEDVMQRLAQETGGTYHRAQDEQALVAIFEELSIQLHDDGIDEVSLRRLAEETGGRYFSARDVSRLHLAFEELAEELQNTYTVTFPSRRSSHDGTARGIDISVIRNGVRVSEVARVDYQVHGVIVPEMDHRVYLIILTLLGGLLVVPAGVRRLYRYYGGA